jgi:hypothetical protein
VVWGPGPYVFYNDQRVAMRRVVADFARNQVKLQYSMDKAIPLEYAVTPPVYPAFTSFYSKGAASPAAAAAAAAGGGAPPRKKGQRQPRPSGPGRSPGGKRASRRVLKSRILYSGSDMHTNTNITSNSTGRRLAPAVENTVWNSTISRLPSSQTSSGRTPLRIVLYSRGNDGTRSLKLESQLMTGIADKFEAYTAICCDFNKVTIQQQISYAYHADIVSAQYCVMMCCPYM